MSHGDAVGNIGHNRLGFLNADAAHSWISCVANTYVTKETSHVVFIKNIADEACPFLYVKTLVVGHDSGGILPTMLKMD